MYKPSKQVAFCIDQALNDLIAMSEAIFWRDNARYLLGLENGEIENA